jgi:hypothetical protein
MDKGKTVYPLFFEAGVKIQYSRRGDINIETD